MEYALSGTVLSLLGAGVGAYFGAYFKKKGENFATHEDIEKLLDQVRAVTQTTKEIEAKISSDLWDKQKQWELKREILFEAAKRLSGVEGALLALQTFWKGRGAADMNEASRISLEHQYVMGWLTSIKSFEEGETLVQITCSHVATGKAFAELTDLLRETAAKITQGDIAFYDQTRLDRQRKFTMAKVAIRNELDLPLDLTPPVPPNSSLISR